MAVAVVVIVKVVELILSKQTWYKLFFFIHRVIELLNDL